MVNMIAIDTSVLVIAGALTASLVIFIVVTMLDKRDAAGFMSFLESNGLEEVTESLPTDRFTLLEGGVSRHVSQRMRRAGLTDSVFVHTITQRSTQGSGNAHRSRVFALVALDADLPRVRIARDGFWSETGGARRNTKLERPRVDIEIGVADFDRVFKVDTKSPEVARELLTPELVEWFMQAERSGWKFDAEISGKWMLFNLGKGSTGLEQRLRWLDQVSEVRSIVASSGVIRCLTPDDRMTRHLVSDTGWLGWAEQASVAVHRAADRLFVHPVLQFESTVADGRRVVDRDVGFMEQRAGGRVHRSEQTHAIDAELSDSFRELDI